MTEAARPSGCAPYPSGYSGGSRAPWRPALPVAEIHQPADAEQRGQEAAEDVQAIVQALFVGSLAHHTQNHRAEQRKQEGCFEVREVHFGHQLFLPPAISYASTMARMLSRPAVTRNLLP